MHHHHDHDRQAAEAGLRADVRAAVGGIVGSGGGSRPTPRQADAAAPRPISGGAKRMFKAHMDANRAQIQFGQFMQNLALADALKGSLRR
jgi:hypothetical protein